MDKLKDSLLSKVEPAIAKIGELTKLQRYIVFCGTILLIVFAYGYFFYLPKQEVISGLNEKYEKLAKDLESTKKKASQLKSYQKKMKEAEVQFQIVQRTLPEKKEIPSLLTAISQAGRDSGLEFLLFQPKKEIKKEFYAEIPVAMKVKGDFHNVALFFDKVGNMSRIVNIRNIQIGGGKSLSTSCTAVTYRFIEISEKKSKKKGKKKKRKRR